ncbi:MAG: tripartite tricarboxylate transporter substrate binding protein [Alphaproteobacteria bacterium]|nr:tripartite tricarboxylate transporter substrate binding protein [Alphaproteobacteria bacterium]
MKLANRLMSLLLAAWLLVFVTSIAQAQSVDYPNRPIRIVIPFGPGGTTDIVARALSEELRSELGQPVVIENKPGADGIIAIQELIRSGGDGHTLMIGNVATNAVGPVFHAGKLPFDYERDVVPVMRLVDIAGVLVATTRNFPPQTLSEMIAYARQHPGQVNYGTPGIGNYVHYDMALLALRAGGLAMTAVPNKAGASGVINDLLVGTVQVAFVNAASTAGSIKAGTLRPLAVANNTRLAALPDIPTMREAGFPGVGTIAWQGLFASAGVPTPIREMIRKATAKALNAPSVRRVLEQQSFNIVPTNSLEEAHAWLAGEVRDWRRIVQETRIEASN